MADNDELQWLIGSMFMMGFTGTTVTPQIRSLIQEYHVGTIFLSAKNISSAKQATELILSLQHIAHQSGYQDPLLIITDQENGGVNSIFDSTYIHQFPSAMGIITSNSPDMAFEVASATGQELSCLGVNWITGPVLDVLSNTRTQPLGVRSLGDDPQEVARYGMKFMEGYHDAGLATCGKHFPSYGNLEFLGSPLDMPTISETIDQLRLGALVPYSIAIKYGLDAMMIGACAMPNFVEGEDITYACLSHAVVSGLLRQEMGFNGVVMSECLEIESLYDSLGVGQAVCAGVCAGCDIFLICNSLPNQLEAMSGLRAGVSNGLVSFDQLQASAARIGQLKKRYTSWEKALNPEGTVGLERLRAKHEELSKRSYDASICVVRDQGGFIPLSTNISAQQALLLLTPLVALFHGTGDTQDDDRTLNFGSPESLRRVAWDTGKTYLEGETTFRQLGLSIAKQWPGKVLHTSYTASGMRPLHEGLVSSTSAVIVLTADANRNTYQYGFVKYVSTICRGQASAELPNGKPCIVVAVSSPYDFFKDVQIGTYVCTFDFTEQALDCLVRTLTGELKPSGIAPGMKPRSKQLETRRGKQKLRQTWLVEDFNEERDMEGLQQLLDTIYVASNGSTNGPDAGHLVSAISAEWFLTGTCPLVEHKHFIVRNSSTKVLYGFCATYTLPRIGRGSIGLILVDPQRRRMGIGHWLHRRASIHMRAQPGLQDVQFGSSFPALCPGVPLQPQPWSLVLQKWATERGWECTSQDLSVVFEIRSLLSWNFPSHLQEQVVAMGLTFEVLKQPESQDIYQHISRVSSLGMSSRNTLRHPAIVMQLYEIALQDSQGCSVITTRDALTTEITGSAILYGSVSKLAEYLPTGQEQAGGVAGITVAAAITPRDDPTTLVQGLLAMAITQFRERGFTSVRIYQADRHPAVEILDGLGFEVVKEYFNVVGKATQLA